jgi:hypothetical protein
MYLTLTGQSMCLTGDQIAEPGSPTQQTFKNDLPKGPDSAVNES